LTDADLDEVEHLAERDAVPYRYAGHSDELLEDEAVRRSSSHYPPSQDDDPDLGDDRRELFAFSFFNKTRAYRS